MYEILMDITDNSTSSEEKISLSNSENCQSEITFANNIDRDDQIMPDETRDLNLFGT